MTSPVTAAHLLAKMQKTSLPVARSPKSFLPRAERRGRAARLQPDDTVLHAELMKIMNEVTVVGKELAKALARARAGRRIVTPSESMLPIHRYIPRPDAQLREVTGKVSATRLVQRPPLQHDGHVSQSLTGLPSHESLTSICATRPQAEARLLLIGASPLPTARSYAAANTSSSCISWLHDAQDSRAPDSAIQTDQGEVQFDTAAVRSTGTDRRVGQNSDASHASWPCNGHHVQRRRARYFEPPSPSALPTPDFASAKSSPVFPPGWSASPSTSSDTGSDMSIDTSVHGWAPETPSPFSVAPPAFMLPIPSPLPKVTTRGSKAFALDLPLVEAPTVYAEDHLSGVRCPRPVPRYKTTAAIELFEEIAWQECHKADTESATWHEPVPNAFYRSGYHLDNSPWAAQNMESEVYEFDEELYASYEWLTGTA